MLQGDPLSETDRSSELRRELIGSHVPQHSLLSKLPRSQTTTTRMKLVGNFEALGAFIQTLHMLVWYCIYLRAFFLNVSADNVLFVQMFIQGSGCFHVYRSLRLESPCPASAPPSSDHSRKTFARCDRFLPSCAVTIIDVVRPVQHLMLLVIYMYLQNKT